jgi:LysR family hydrogen peroxide-inducible transcriptional activator
MQSSPRRQALDASSLSTLVQMVSAGMGVTLIPEMAVAVETRSAQVSVARFGDPQPSRTVGMIWRKTSPLAGLLLQLSQLIRHAAGEFRDEHRRATSRSRRAGDDHEPGYSANSAGRRKPPRLSRGRIEPGRSGAARGSQRSR